MATSAPKPTLWQKYRALPLWLQILIPLVILAIIVGVVWALASSNDDSDSSATTDTTVVDNSNMDEILKGIIIVGGIAGGNSSTTTTEAATTTTVERTTTTLAPTTTVAATTPAPTTTAAAVTPPPVTTAAPATTTAPATTQAPTTTAAPATTQAPTTTTSPASPLPAPADFLTQWNAATEGTNVPTISKDQITEIVQGPFAGAFLATLSPTSGDTLPPQVGLIGTLSADDPTQLAEVLLVYIPGPDESASEFYWESFAVLTRAVDPGTTDAQITALEKSLGRADGKPPFPAGTDNSAESNGFDYRLYVGTTQDGTEATGISVM